MSTENKHGLSRYIPPEVKKIIRQKSKFGCVVCRMAYYQFEHIEPTFEFAKKTRPEQDVLFVWVVS